MNIRRDNTAEERHNAIEICGKFMLMSSSKETIISRANRLFARSELAKLKIET